jgi:hypothetical protein
MHKAWWVVLASAMGALLPFGLLLQLVPTGAVATAVSGSEPIGILIDAVLYDGYAYLDYDEAVRLVNTGNEAADLAGWRLSDGVSVATLPAGAILEAGQTLWLARNSAAFTFQFGFEPGIVLATWPGFANTGDEVFLTLPDGAVVDGLVYGAGDTAQSWWQGPAVQPYKVTSLFAAEGQILYRRSDPLTGARLPDSNGEQDWAQTGSDPVAGRKVQYPGWELDRFFQPLRITETATITPLLPRTMPIAFGWELLSEPECLSPSKASPSSMLAWRRRWRLPPSAASASRYCWKGARSAALPTRNAGRASRSSGRAALAGS